LLALLAACAARGNDGAFARYLEAQARPLDPSVHVEFGRASLPSDFPPGLPVPPKATLLGWTRTTSRTALAWEAIYTASGDTGTMAATLEDALSGRAWQVRDRADVHGFQSLDLAGSGANEGRTAEISVGPAGGGVQIVEDVTAALPAVATPGAGSR
jgi:hypothetical protein